MNLTKRLARRAGLGIMFMLIAAGRGNAGALLWNVSFTLDDGGHGTGTFVFDADLVNTCSNCPMLNWNITVSGGNVGLFPAFTYTPADSFASRLFLGAPAPPCRPHITLPILQT